MILFNTLQGAKQTIPAMPGFLASFFSSPVFSLTLQAAKRNLTYPRYAWITFGGYPVGWWTNAVSKNDVSCSDQQLEDFIVKARMFLIQQYPTPDNTDGMTIAEIVSLKVLVAIKLVHLVTDLLHPLL